MALISICREILTYHRRFFPIGHSFSSRAGTNSVRTIFRRFSISTRFRTFHHPFFYRCSIQVESIIQNVGRPKETGKFNRNFLKRKASGSPGFCNGGSMPRAESVEFKEVYLTLYEPISLTTPVEYIFVCNFELNMLHMNENVLLN